MTNNNKQHNPTLPCGECGIPHAEAWGASGNHTFFIKTYGCQMNEYDSLSMSQLLLEKGFDEAASMEEAEIVILETCSVRQKAEDKVMGMLGKLAKRKKKTGLPFIIVAGCMAERVKQDLAKRFKEIDLIVGPGHIHEIAEKVEEIAGENRLRKKALTAIGFEDTKDTYHKGLYSDFTGIKAFVTAIRGCTNYCSYCIVPYVRGPERSRTPEEIVQEITELTSKGVKEVTLLGQNINIFGRDLKPQTDFIALLKQIIGIEDLLRIRFITTHPKDTRPELIELMAKEKKLMPFLHMPFQTGANTLLQKMNRRYTREEYIEKIETFQKIYPELSFSTDIIVGYPGETEEDFLLTKEMVERIRFDGAFIFKYSDRSGTKAENEEGKLDMETIVRRHKTLLDLQNAITLEKNKSLEGKEVSVLVEGESKTDKSRLTGRTEHNMIAVFEKDDGINVGSIITTKVISALGHTLYCQLLKY